MQHTTSPAARPAFFAALGAACWGTRMAMRGSQRGPRQFARHHLELARSTRLAMPAVLP